MRQQYYLFFFFITNKWVQINKVQIVYRTYPIKPNLTATHKIIFRQYIIDHKY